MIFSGVVIDRICILIIYILMMVNFFLLFICGGLVSR